MTTYRICNRCVMDTSAPDISFDKDGNCNFCTDFLRKYSTHYTPDNNRLYRLIEKIQRAGKGKPYDCIVGVSGGIDSSYVLYLAKQYGLRPLASHMDNGWDTELATNNIANLVRKLNVDLFTYVIDWEEYRDLMNAFFKANVVDIEMLYDNAMNEVNYRQARKLGIKYLLSGNNIATEGMQMPQGWNYLKVDGKNIRAIHKQFGTQKMKTFPLITVSKFIFTEFILQTKKTPILNYVNFKKEEALNLLIRKFDYKPYPYKHYESVFTRFYQGYILPKKFGIDKRKLHLSNLVVTNQMTRNEALEILKQSPYPSPKDLEDDIEYFLKKMHWKKEELEAYIKHPPIPHTAYKNDFTVYKTLLTYYKKLFTNKIQVQ